MNIYSALGNKYTMSYIVFCSEMIEPTRGSLLFLLTTKLYSAKISLCIDYSARVNDVLEVNSKHICTDFAHNMSMAPCLVKKSWLAH